MNLLWALSINVALNEARDVNNQLHQLEKLVEIRLAWVQRCEK